MKKRICDHAAAVLERIGCQFLMVDDKHLLRTIAEEAGLPSAERVLAGLRKTPGRLLKMTTPTTGGRRMLVFRLPS